MLLKFSKKLSKLVFKLTVLSVSYAVLITVALMLSLRFVNPDSSSYIDRYEIAAKREAKFEWVDFNDIHWSLPLAVIASEDQRFPKHWGLDLEQIKKAIKENKTRKTPRGASTITQQTVKNLYLSGKRSYTRKVIEAWLSVWMELILPKKRILEIYLNIAQFGKSTFGAQAASRHYFSKSANKLNAMESRLLAASLPTPSRSNAAKPSAYLLSRNDQLREAMEKMGKRLVDAL